MGSANAGDFGILSIVMTQAKDAQRAADTGPGQERDGPLARRQKAAADALRTLVRDLYTRRFGVPLREQEMTLSLSVRVTPKNGWQLAFSPDAEQQLIPQLEDIQAAHDVFQHGRVYCFRCDSATCAHAAAPSSLAVFGGYAASGVPLWPELTQALLTARHERVDTLFAKPPRLVALAQAGDALHEQQLSSFGRASKTYALLGQVVAGYFRLPAAVLPHGKEPRFALTLQIVETRTANGKVRLHLNTLACLPAGLSLQTLFANDWAPWLARAWEKARRALQSVERRAVAARGRGQQAKTAQVLREVGTILGQLAASIERGQRQARRRTQHAEQRRRDKRPIKKAVDDLLAAPADAMYADERNDTVVVFADGKRAHVFNPEGRHVTSFAIRPDAVALRLKRKRWKPLAPADAEKLKVQAAGRLDP